MLMLQMLIIEQQIGNIRARNIIVLYIRFLHVCTNSIYGVFRQCFAL